MKGLLAGALAGLGEGLEKSGKAKREEAREAVRWAREQQARDEDRRWRSQEAQADRDWRSQEAATGREHDFGLLGARQSHDFAKLERQHQHRLAQIDARLAPEGVAGEGGGEPHFGMSAEEKRLYDEIKHQYSDDTGQIIDWDSMLDHLQRLGSPVAKRLVSLLNTHTPESARQAAEDEARRRSTGWFTSDSSAFPETDGDRDAWIARRAEKLLRREPGRDDGGGNTAEISAEDWLQQRGGGW